MNICYFCLKNGPCVIVFLILLYLLSVHNQYSTHFSVSTRSEIINFWLFIVCPLRYCILCDINCRSMQNIVCLKIIIRSVSLAWIIRYNYCWNLQSLRERPFFLKKNILIPNVAEKIILILVEEKKIIRFRVFVI